LVEKIRTRRARVGVVGLGYVGLPLAVEFAAAGFTVTGIDISEEKVRRVNAGDSCVSGGSETAEANPAPQAY
jgi:UDP-N-acetyl-D-glucosamine dehydrogenase